MIIYRPTQASLLEGSLPLSQRLREGGTQVDDPIPTVLLRKYLAFVRQTVNPRMSDEATNVLKQFYLDLRDKYADDDSIPITLRQFESLVRLSQRLKLEFYCPYKLQRRQYPLL